MSIDNQGPQWIYEDGIGEQRALLIQNGQPIALRLQHPQIMRYGRIFDGKIVKKISGKNLAIILDDNDVEALLQPIPKGVSEGQHIRAEIKREPIEEKGRFKFALAKPALDLAKLSNGYDLAQIISAPLDCKQAEPKKSVSTLVAANQQKPPRKLTPQIENIFDYGWEDLYQMAWDGQWVFEGGELDIHITPAMTLIDIDGSLPPYQLAKKAAEQVAKAIYAFDLQGSIGVDFPTLALKSERQEICDIFDAHMHANCERTAVNGFGFMQIVRRRTGPSVVEILQYRRSYAAAVQILARAANIKGAGQLQIKVHPAIAALLEQNQGLVDSLQNALGRQINLSSSGHLPIYGALFHNEAEIYG
ncbi:hypothetical protein LPB140_10600 [Sphingorhabdus lutea]|uniref:RNA-binding protein AU-1/Ribonuclease E/G domain-containing protein n=1 Tax=Sphingorhabdus lutea TaxID=1913578 RepID=A0A1L3JDF5_9SPHN|nr:ribonuclease E/G [Sphingorhabdus lutea]APG63164.1 hypothetical protein LPB140_10600 [Sphingorhabdus lutea]